VAASADGAALRQALVEQNPADRQASIDLMVSQLETGEVLARRLDFAAAADHYRMAIARGEPMMATDPSYVYYRLTMATALTRLGQALIAKGHTAEAEPLVRRAIDLAESASTKDAADARLRFEVAMARRWATSRRRGMGGRERRRAGAQETGANGTSEASMCSRNSAAPGGRALMTTSRN
jgi:hypothetical protein